MRPLVLDGQRIRLRHIARDDADALFALYADTEVMRYWNHAPWRSIDQALDAIDEARADYATGASLHCAIEHIASGVLIGSCALYALAPQHRSASLGYLLAQQYWGHGYLAEAMHLLLDYAFTDMGLNRIDADVNLHNAGSMIALERLGFRREGRMRARWIVDGTPQDTYAYGLLRHDWLAR